jgi:hypothetical protein
MFGSSIEISREICQITERRESIVNHSDEERRLTKVPGSSDERPRRMRERNSVVGKIRPRRLAEVRAFIVALTGGNQTRCEPREAGK